MYTIQRLLAALLASTSWTLAYYIIDDTNQTIQYSPLGRWLGVTCSVCYNGTETYNPYGCNTTDNCHMQIPFIGSGITLYMTFVYPTNYNVSIDGSTPVQFRLDQPPSVSYNFTAYDQQFLQFGQHNLDLMPLDANETADSAHNSNFLFDYAVINDTIPFPGATTSSASIYQPSSASVYQSSSASVYQSSSASIYQSKKGANAGAIAGGIVGGFAFLAGLGYLVLFYRRRARSNMSNLPPPRNHPMTRANIPSTVNPLQGTSTYGPAATSVQYPSTIMPMPMPPRLPHNPPASQPLFPVGTSAVSPSLLPLASLPPHPDNSPATTILSGDQLNLLHHLSASNTPGSVLAAVAQSMVHGSRDRPHLGPVDVASPPAYSPTAD